MSAFANSWDAMRGMRNRIAHGYEDMNLETVWATAESFVPQLIAEVTLILERSD
jgi:uncharacterized protein with HEPN domain